MLEAAARAEPAHPGAWQPPAAEPGLGTAPWPCGSAALCLGNPPGWALALARVRKAVVGAKVSPIKSWVRAVRSPCAGAGSGSVPSPWGLPGVSLDGTEGIPGAGPGLLGPGCCLEMLPFCSVHPGSLCNVS